MASTPDEMMKFHSAMAQASSAAALKTLEGFQKLAHVNLQAARESMETSTEQIRALLAAKDVNSLTELVSSFAQPSADKFTAYAKAVYSIASETNAELTEMIKQQIAKGNSQMASAIADLAKNAPAGSDGAVNFITQALATANASYDQLNEATRRFVEMGSMGAGSAATKSR
jgi:phasin family protein